MASPVQPPDRPGEAAGTGDHRSEATPKPASAVYGTVLAGSLIALQGAHKDVSIPRLVIVVMITQCVYWLSHTYAELVGGRISGGQRPHRGEVSASLREEWPMVLTALIPLAVIVLFWATGVAADIAVLAGLCSVAVALCGWVLLAGRRAHLNAGELLLYVTVSAGVGIALVLLKIYVH